VVDAFALGAGADVETAGEGAGEAVPAGAAEAAGAAEDDDHV